MTNEEIKQEKERCFEQIKSAEDRLKEIREICTHDETFECNYSWAIGHFVPAKVCSHCGEFIESLI